MGISFCAFCENCVRCRRGSPYGHNPPCRGGAAGDPSPPGERLAKRVPAFGCFGATDAGSVHDSPAPWGKPIKSDLTKALSGRSISVSGPTGRRRPRREWANTGNHPQLSNHTTPFYLMRRERVASATSYRQSSLSACFLRSWKRRRVPQ